MGRSVITWKSLKHKPAGCNINLRVTINEESAYFNDWVPGHLQLYYLWTIKSVHKYHVYRSFELRWRSVDLPNVEVSMIFLWIFIDNLTHCKSSLIFDKNLECLLSHKSKHEKVSTTQHSFHFSTVTSAV